MQNSSLNSLFDDNRVFIIENGLGQNQLKKVYYRPKKKLIVKKTIRYDPQDDPVDQILKFEQRVRSHTLQKNSARPNPNNRVKMEQD